MFARHQKLGKWALGWPILILGPLLEEEDDAVVDFDLIQYFHQKRTDRFIKLSHKYQKQISVHLKIDSGMGRHGIWWQYASELD